MDFHMGSICFQNEPSNIFFCLGLPYDFHMTSIWFQIEVSNIRHGNIISIWISIWVPYASRTSLVTFFFVWDFHMTSIWFQIEASNIRHGFMISIWISIWVPYASRTRLVTIFWLPYDFHMTSIWVPYASRTRLDNTWKYNFHIDFHMSSIWFQIRVYYFHATSISFPYSSSPRVVKCFHMSSIWFQTNGSKGPYIYGFHIVPYGSRTKLVKCPSLSVPYTSIPDLVQN